MSGFYREDSLGEGEDRPALRVKKSGKRMRAPMTDRN